MHLAPEDVTLALFGALIVVLAVWGVRAWLRSRISPDEQERRRRQMLLSTGKTGDADLVEVRDNLLFYSYQVRGVEYTASQDVSNLKPFLPDGMLPLGHISMKYDPRNPANSMVLAEEWSGLRDLRFTP